jgi:hypothetical protein
MSQPSIEEEWATYLDNLRHQYAEFKEMNDQELHELASDEFDLEPPEYGPAGHEDEECAELEPFDVKFM